MAAIPDAHLIPNPPSAAALGHSRSFAGAAVALNVIATIVFFGRMWTRSFPIFRMQADDYVCIVAYILVVVDSTLLLLTIPYAFDRDPSTWTLADSEDSFRYATIAQPLWAWAMATIKTSIALMLLRLEQTKSWRRFLWAMIVIQALLGLYNMLTQLLQCIPLRGAWDLLGVVEKKCWSSNAVRISSICVSTVNIATDFVFSLLPISFLRKVQRPLRERAIIGMLMALGIFAGVASIIKITAAATFGRTNDPTNESVQIGMWSCIEELIGLIAACVPCLRAPFQHVLEYFGLVSTHHKTSYAGGYGQMYGDSGKRGFTKGRLSASGMGGAASAIKMKSMRSADAQSEENILAGEDAKNGEIWCTTEVHVADEARQTPKLGGRPNASWSDESARSRDIPSRGMNHV